MTRSKLPATSAPSERRSPRLTAQRGGGALPSSAGSNTSAPASTGSSPPLSQEPPASSSPPPHAPRLYKTERRAIAAERACASTPSTHARGNCHATMRSTEPSPQPRSRQRAGARASPAPPRSPSPRSRPAKARWEPSNPNVCTLEAATGALLELKVTKRSFESPGPGGFGSSEYSRVAVAQGGVAAVPQILARRLQTRYRFDDNASVIEALEIQNVYDPQATGFADLNGAQPVATVKSRLTLSR